MLHRGIDPRQGPGHFQHAAMGGGAGVATAVDAGKTCVVELFQPTTRLTLATEIGVKEGPVNSKGRVREAIANTEFVNQQHRNEHVRTPTDNSTVCGWRVDAIGRKHGRKLHMPTYSTRLIS